MERREIDAAKVLRNARRFRIETIRKYHKRMLQATSLHEFNWFRESFHFWVHRIIEANYNKTRLTTPYHIVSREQIGRAKTKMRSLRALKNRPQGGDHQTIKD
jgi:hypothetical protein